MFVMTSFMKIVTILILQYGIVTMGLEFEKIEIPALEPLFRERLNSKRLEVVNYSATSLLPIDENFQNSLVQLNVTIRRDENAKEEQVYLVARTLEISDEPFPAWSEMFKKEVFAYLELLSAYRNIEREAGVNARELFDPSPRYFGHRYSLDLNSEKIDKHVTLLMENLAAHGYKFGDKCKGLPVQYATKALTTLARYHALGIALKLKRPDFFKKVRVEVRPEIINYMQIDFTFDVLQKDFVDDPSILRDHFSVIKASYENSKSLTISPAEPWGTVIHGDFGTHNIMFYTDGAGNVKDAKFLDYQLILFHSALKDVSAFLCVSLDEDAFDHYIDYLLNYYYHSFHMNLIKLGIDRRAYTRESFDKELKKRALEQLPFCATFSKLLAAQAAEGQDTNSFLSTALQGKSSDSVKNKLRKLVRTYEERGWFS